MSKMITVRLHENVLARVDAERKRAGLTRAAVIHQALALWVEKRHYDDAVKREHAAYAQRPVRANEFTTVLGAQRWPK